MSLRNSNKTITFADKTTKSYRLEKKEHGKILKKAGTFKY